MGNRSNINLVGNTTTGQNLGSGAQIFSGKNNGNNLQFKSLSAGTGIVMTSQANTVTICSLGGGGGSITGGTNGLSTSGANIILGGTLTGNTSLDLGTNAYSLAISTDIPNVCGCEATLYINGNPGGSPYISLASRKLGGCSFSGYMSFSGGTIKAGASGVNFPGIEYVTDYSADFTNRSLVDKEYVDTHIPTGSTGGGIGWSNALNGSTVAGCGTPISGSTLCDNTYFGVSAGTNTTTGTGNVAIGACALMSVIIGNSNTAVGSFALKSNTSSQNTAFGYEALSANVSGYDNTAVGTIALNSNINGFGNVALGSFALSTNSSGYQNIGVGYQSLFYNTTGYDNIGIGYRALYFNTGGTNNIGIGCQSLCSNTSGGNNIALGQTSMTQNLSGQYNIGLGFNTLGNNTIANYNIALGYQALCANTIGDSNIAIGINSMTCNVDGYDNIGIGIQALQCNVSGIDNIAIGSQSLKYITGGTFNIGIGNQTLKNNICGCNNIAIGVCAGYNETGSSKLHIANCASCTLICGDFVNQSVKLDACLAVVHVPNGATATQGLVWDTGSTLIKQVPIINEWVSSTSEILYTGQKFAYPTQTIMQTDVGTCVTVPNYIVVRDINLKNVGDTLIFSIPSGKVALLNRAKLIILCNASPTCFSVSIGNNCCPGDPSLSMNNLANLQQISDVLTNETYELDLSTRHQGVPDTCGVDIFFRVGCCSTSVNPLCAHLLVEGFVY
jgi:hypothetical protein